MTDYIVFIISHKKPDEVRTLKSLMDSGFFGDYRIIIDSNDETAEKYEEIIQVKLKFLIKLKLRKHLMLWIISTYFLQLFMQEISVMNLLKN